VKKGLARFEWLPLILLSFQLVLYAFIWLRLLGDPSLRGMDFISFYTAGRLARAGDYHQLYNLTAQSAVQAPIAGAEAFPGGVNLSQHPPYLAPLLALIAGDDFTRSYVLWTLVRLIVMAACGELIWRFLLRRGWGRRTAWLGALGCLTFFPFFLALLSGQDTAFILLGLLLWMFALLEGHELQAGFGLALASLSPTIAGALGLPLLALRRRAAGWFVLGLLLLAVCSLLLVGVQGAKDFLGLLRLSSQGGGYGLNQLQMYNLLGLLLRNAPGLNPGTARGIAWGAALLSVAGLCMLWWKMRQSLGIELIGIAVILGVFTSPHLHVHGLSYLLLPALGLMIILWERGRRFAALLFLPLTSTLMLLFAFFVQGWSRPVAYLLMMILLIGLIINLQAVVPAVSAEE
jgi:hypothetical protein